MKLKSVLLEILIVLFIAGSFYITAFFEGGLGKSTDFIVGIASGALLGLYLHFWTVKKDLKLTEHLNVDKAIQTWRYLMLFFAISFFCDVLFICRRNHLKSKNCLRNDFDLDDGYRELSC